MTGIKVNADVSWAGDSLPCFAGESLEDVPLDTLLATFSGDWSDEVYGYDEDSPDDFGWGWFKKLGKSVAHAVHKVAKPVAIVAGVGAAGAAVVFPPAAPALGAVAAQAALAGAIAGKLDSSISVKRRDAKAQQQRAEKRKAQKMVAATTQLARSKRASPAQRAAAQRALRGIRAARIARARASMRRLAFAVTRRGFVVRVK